MRVPDVVRDGVLFLGRIIRKGSTEDFVLAGTGFIASVPSRRRERVFCYVITAKHVAEQLALGDFGARINDKAGGSFIVQGGRDVKWWYHPTESQSVDVAVTPFDMPDNADLAHVPESMFLTDGLIEERNIGAGDEVFMTGLFSKMQGRLRNLPIVRMGNIALVPPPGECIPGMMIGGQGVDAEAYLVEARSTGGMSGSPAFVRETCYLEAPVGEQGRARNTQMALPGEVFLLGLVHGHWDIAAKDKNEVRVKTGKSAPGEDVVNLGIAIVIPAKRIREVLYQPGLVEERARADEADERAEGSSTPD